MSSTDSAEEVAKAMATTVIEDTDVAKRPREAGWAEPQKYDYEKYNAGPPLREEHTSGDESAKNLPVWAANALKYEWSDEYGEIGPRHETLEEMLFNNEHIQRTGIAFDKYVFKYFRQYLTNS